ncbi:HAD-IA family hydrolase [Bacillus suaedaesalsae]|uniref:HAD-IA family hydrolase n=1 Tax=Bacillus suaedaesalsae TaxID=2810349 RepID=A0ABS2DGE2_9BACI|nr:HAD-IA family hydrolase [Bacillus suaedaesalsae]MBM6617557.1 HAD-IA family hydrolase [Bacillus suaedaesalsae]
MNILWDFDGTIIDTYPVYTRVFQRIAGEHIPLDKILAQMKVSFTQAETHFQLTEQQKKQLRFECDQISVDSVSPFPFVEDILQRADTNVIMTHKSKQQVIDILTYHRLYDYFTDMVTADDNFPRKPNASSYRYLHEKHKLNLAIGDREIDILPAKEIGLKTCLFQNNTAGADYYLQSYKEFHILFSE